MFNIGDIIVHKETGIKATVIDICNGGYLIQYENGKTYFPHGTTIEKSFRIATSSDGI